MTNENTVTEKARDMSREVVKRDDDIRDEVRDIVVAALVEHHLEKDNVKRVIDAVLEGAMDGAPDGPSNVADALRNTVDGLDQGLSKAAEASKLAIEEASGRADEFSENDIKRALDDLKGLEELFTQTLRDFVDAGRDTTKGALSDLIKHTDRTGTATGKSVADAMGDLQKTLSKVEPLHVADIGKATRASVATIASITSGILDGLAQSLRHEKGPDVEPDGTDDKKE